MAQKKRRASTARSESGAKKRRSMPTEPEPDEEEDSAIEESGVQDDVDVHEASSNDENLDGSGSGDERSEGVEGRAVRRSNGKKNKPPTRAELRAIKEASDLYKSNMFKLAIDALLPNVRPKESRIKPLEEFLRLLYRSLMSLSSKPPSHPLEAARALGEQGVQLPYATPQPTQETAWKVAFEKPNEILIVGSWATKTGAKSPSAAAWTVDVAVEMPSSLFQEKDYLDCRFFHKKAYYLALLAAGICADENLRVDVFYDSPLDSRLTSLILVPRNDGSSTDFTKLKAHIRMLPVLPSSSPVSLHHLSPTHCNLRVKTSEPDANTLTSPTPAYNADLLMCASVRHRLLRTYELAKEVPSHRDTLALLHVWANQRGYSPGPKEKVIVAGFEGKGFFWTTVMHAVLVGEETFGQKTTKAAAARRPVRRGLSSYQLFRAALDFLANHDFTSAPTFVKGGSKYPPDTYGSRNPVFVDTCSVNILAGIPLSSLTLLRRDAKMTLNRLNGSTVDEDVDPFNAVFLRDHRQLLARFDVVLGVDLRKASLRNSNLIEILDYGSSSRAMLHSLSSLLRSALGDRVHAVGILVPPRDLRPLSQGSTVVSLSRVHIGLILNTENAFRLVDHGPAVSEQDSQEAVEFRELWGNKAELRRFKDGRIEESVVWEVKSVDARARIPADIVCHILARHFGVDPNRDVRTFQKEFDELLRVPEVLAQRVVLPGARPGFKNALTAFDDLVRMLKSLDDAIPLAILNVSPASSSLRYTSVFTPLPIPPKGAMSLMSTMRYLPSMEVIIQFERSGRWPDDLIAIQKMKLAFYEQMANALMSKVRGLRASVVASTQQTTLGNLDNAYLELVTSDGWAFAARIWHDREATLLKRIVEKKFPTANGNGAVSIPTPDGRMQHEHGDKQAAARAYDIYTRRYLHAPKHHRAIANLCHLFPAFAGTVRLVKRWFSSHWLYEGHVSDEATELLCAYVFVGSATGGPPQSGGDKTRQNVDVPGTRESGFFRVLAFLKEWAWESGLLVSLYEEDAPDADGKEEEGESARVRVRAGSGSGVWTISTTEDRTGKVWTAEGPDALAARRIRSLASASLEYALANEREGFITKSLFLHPTNDYDLLIRLKPEVLCRTHHSLDAAARAAAMRNLPGPTDDEPLRVDFDPARMFFNDLKRVYRGTLALFFDPLGETVIGAVWDPSVLTTRPFRVLADYSTMPSVDEKRKQKAMGTVVLNQAAVLAEIRRLGEGIVKSIEVQRTP